MPHVSSRRWSRRRTLQTGLLSLAAPLVGPAVAAPRVFAQATPLPMQGDAMAPETQVAVLNVISDALAGTRTPGAIVGAWVPGHGVAMVAAGIGELPTAAPITLDDHFRIASITKTFTATIVLQLVDDGALSLDDHLEDFVPGVPNGAEITLRQLLSMRSGVPDFAAQRILSLAYMNEPAREFSPAETLKTIQLQPATVAPGSVWSYSNSNYLLLGLIIEQVTGQSLPTVYAERILTPLGLSSTSLPDTADLPEPFAHGYFSADPDGVLQDYTRQNPNYFWAAGGMVSTLLDLKVWGQALATGALLSPEMHAAQIDPTLQPSIPGGAYGLGVLNFGGLIGHNGNVPGYESWLLSDQATGATLVILANRMHQLDGASGRILNGLLELLMPDQYAALSEAPTGTPVATPTS